MVASEGPPAKPTGTGKPTGTPAPKSTAAKPTGTPARSAPGPSAAPPKSRPARPRLRPRRAEGARTGPKRTKGKPGAKSGVGPAPPKRRSAPTSTRRPPAPAPTAPTPSEKAPRTRGLLDPRRNRHRAPLALAALFAVGVLVIGFPLSGLLSQHHQLSAAAAQLNQLQSQNRTLKAQQHQLNSKAAIERLARQDYQLVSPGQTLYDVLPSGRHTSTTTASQSATVGDPGNQPLVAPANAPDMSPEPGQPHELSVGGATPAHGGSGATGSKSGSTDGSGSSGIPPGPSSFWSRVTGSLAFWR
jgi:cell division protein FtsB